MKSRVESGDYTNDSEYIRDLIRKDQQVNEKKLMLRYAINEGLESGISSRSVMDIMQSVEEKLSQDGKL